MIVKDILASTYILLNNASHEELDYAIAIEQLGNVLSKMKMEKILATNNELIRKSTLTYSDTTGVIDNTLTKFGEPIFAKFNNIEIDVVSPEMLSTREDECIQAISFWEDDATNTKKIQLAIKEAGTLEVWYEPYDTVDLCGTAEVGFDDSLRYGIVTRHAELCLPYVNYNDPQKEIYKEHLILALNAQAEDWRQSYLEKINRIGTGKPIQRVPFRTGYRAD